MSIFSNKKIHKNKKRNYIGFFFINILQYLMKPTSIFISCIFLFGNITCHCFMSIFQRKKKILALLNGNILQVLYKMTHCSTLLREEQGRIGTMASLVPVHII